MASDTWRQWFKPRMATIEDAIHRYYLHTGSYPEGDGAEGELEQAERLVGVGQDMCPIPTPETCVPWAG